MSFFFRSGWCIFEFIVLLVSGVDVIHDLVLIGLGMKHKESGNWILSIVCKILLVLRIVRLFLIGKLLSSNLRKCCDKRVDSHMAYAYELGKSYVTGEEEVMEMLNFMIDNDNIRNDMAQRMTHDKQFVIKLLGLVQKDKPWISITVKTKQAIRTVLNNMKDAFNELKISGWVDDYEYDKLMESLMKQYKFVSSITTVEPSPPKVIFKEVPWMGGEENIINFLYENVITKKFDPRDSVCKEGKAAEGIYVVVTGKTFFFLNKL